MANTPNSQLVKLALGVVSIAALAGITGRMSTASATEAEISTSDSTTAESETKSKKKSESIIILGREFDKHDLKFWDDDNDDNDCDDDDWDEEDDDDDDECRFASPQDPTLTQDPAPQRTKTQRS